MEADRDNDGRPDDQKETWPPDRTIAAMSRQVLVDHYVNRDIVAVMRRMAPDMTWIGPLACQRTCSAEDMRHMLEPEYGTAAEMFDESWGVRDLPGARVAIGTYRARVPGSAAPELEFLQSATFVWAMTPAGPKVVHLHLSNAYDVPASLDRSAVPGEDAVGYVVDAVALPAASHKRLAFDVPGAGARYVTEDRVLCLDATEVGSAVVWEGGEFPVRERLAAIEDRLPPSFVRVHRSCIVNAKRVAVLRRFEAVLDDGSSRPIAERRYLEVAEAVERAAGKPLREG